MRKIAIMVLAAMTFAGLAPSVAGATATAPGSGPSSYVPHTGTHSHVYGTPIQPPTLGHAKASHYKHAQKKTSTGAATRSGAHLLPRHR
jgi:hypothetical protein